MKFRGSLIAICCGAVLMAACKKEDSSATKKLLMDGRWQVTASTATTFYNGKDTTLDLMSTWNECEKDDIAEFKSNGKATQDEGANKCPDDPQTTAIKYALLNNDTRIALVDDNPDTFDLHVTTTELKLTIVKPNSSGTVFTYVETYKNIR
ncbi:lipocalin family protein [Polluticoccus soli]|uniref:lipocalin family protein n=1 Tax=Polluticoccus soli TaxID=3034150 RepID=UPI0023E0A285|nr:lipocalin family protein [Flavipsychrobacter sp. JY13-12]